MGIVLMVTGIVTGIVLSFKYVSVLPQVQAVTQLQTSCRAGVGSGSHTSPIASAGTNTIPSFWVSVILLADGKA